MHPYSPLRLRAVCIMLGLSHTPKIIWRKPAKLLYVILVPS